MKKYYLGEFEEIVLLTIGILNKDAYGVSVKNEIEARLERDVTWVPCILLYFDWRIKGISSLPGESRPRIEREGREGILRSRLSVKKQSLTQKTPARSYGMPFQKWY